MPPKPLTPKKPATPAMRSKSLYLPEPLHDRIAALAESERRTWNQMAVTLLEDGLSAREASAWINKSARIWGVDEDRLS